MARVVAAGAPDCHRKFGTASSAALASVRDSVNELGQDSKPDAAATIAAHVGAS